MKRLLAMPRVWRWVVAWILAVLLLTGGWYVFWIVLTPRR